MRDDEKSMCRTGDEHLADLGQAWSAKPKKENGIIAKARQVTYYQRHGCYGAADLS
jgi:hypothetical protein